MRKILSFFLLFLLVFSIFGVTASAYKSPTAPIVESDVDLYYFNLQNEGAIYAQVYPENKSIHLSATPNEGYEFVKWEFSDSFFMLDGGNSINDKELTLCFEEISESDICSIKAYFLNSKGEEIVLSFERNTNQDEYSPKTSDDFSFIIYILLMIITLFGLILSFSKILKIHTL